MRNPNHDRYKKYNSDLRNDNFANFTLGYSYSIQRPEVSLILLELCEQLKVNHAARRDKKQ
ncbi:hypothetical protein D3C78_1458490 [compost metagenome]